MMDAHPPVALDNATLAVIGLGYVGLPLAVEFGKQRPVIGFDINARRVAELQSGTDHTLEVPDKELRSATYLRYSTQPQDLRAARIFIITVPTPVDDAKRPDLTPLIAASTVVGQVLKPGDIVVYESTVYPGATEEICVPVLEQHSGLHFNRDFYCGYSPERINPGDKQHRLPNICKITSGSTPEAAEVVDALYRSIITAGTHRASSIKVAEAAKVIENTQRDINIALMNELSLIFHKMNLDTLEVLEAAGTKWNFQPFRPGLVGGHCIGVDPYYLTFKAQEIGHHPEIILAGRRINDSMPEYVASRVVKLMAQRQLPIHDARVLILGLSFKEACKDIRNTKVIDIARELQTYQAQVDIYDPWVDPEEAAREFGLPLLADTPAKNHYHAIILAVAHPEFIRWGGAHLHRFGQARHVLFDVKSALPRTESDGRL